MEYHRQSNGKIKLILHCVQVVCSHNMRILKPAFQTMNVTTQL